MSVEIDPAELSFHRPFTQESAQVLKIKNPNTSPVAFKVKTTAPKQYCVRPNSGRIEPGHEVEISVLLQAFKQEPPLDARCRDKFLVQSVAITSDNEFNNVTQIWDFVDKSAVQEKKIRVNWLPPLGSEGHNERAMRTPMRQSLTNGVDATPDYHPPPAYAASPIDEHLNHDVSEYEATNNTRRSSGPETSTESTTTVQAALASAKQVASTTAGALEEQLANAQAKIVSLEQEVAKAAGLRQRKTGASEKNEDAAAPAGKLAQAQSARQGTEGVPVQIVAALCLVSFFLAYFFF